MRKRYISESSDWSFELIEKYDRKIGELADEFKLDTYPNQIEIIRSEQMMDAYASVGMPLGYNHWSYGKHFLNVQSNYKRGAMGLAYEIVINSDPCIAYLMEENTMTMQALVIAHAAYGHNSFFKSNYLFRAWTDAGSIIDYLLFAKNYIAMCEERYSVDEVEAVLDSCHALMNYGVDRYRRPYPVSIEKERAAQLQREEFRQQQVNALWRTIPTTAEEENPDQEENFPSEPQENILYFIEKNAPNLESWQREIVRIVRKIAQYFYPQRQTQVMNEGWATFWHYTLLNELYDRGLVTDGFMIEFLQAHTGVIYQPPFDSPYYSGINVYTLGFSMMRDIRRICENPTAEDRQWFPDFAGSNWLETMHFAMKNFKDESFILQFLSPKIIRDLRLFNVLDDIKRDELEISTIHNENGYRTIRELLAAQYNLSYKEPDIQIHKVNIKGDRSLLLRHQQRNGVPLMDSADEVLRHLHRLWHFDVHLESVQDGKLTETLHCPPPQEKDAANSLVPLFPAVF